MFNKELIGVPEPITVGDLESLMDLENSAFPIDHWSEELMMQHFREHPEGFRVIRAGKRVVGYIFIDKISDTEGLISSVAVLDEFRGLGLGETLVRLGMDLLKQQGFTRIILRTRVDNEPMKALTKKLGFQVRKTITNFYAENGDALEMELSYD